MRRWVADELAEAASAVSVTLVHSWGLDVPAGADDAFWWTPTEHAARLLASGVRFPLCAPGPRWLAELDEDLTGRPVWAGTLAEIDAAPRAGFAKPAEMKVEALPAAWWSDAGDFAAAATAAGLPPQTWVQVSPTRLDLRCEFRAFVCSRRVSTISAYLADGLTYIDGMERQRDLPHAAAAEFAAAVVDALGDRQPPAYTLDVAVTDTGRWVVLEGNPAWSSAFYGCDRGSVVQTLARCVVEPQDREWLWVPDPHLVRRAERARPLPRR